MHIGRNGFFFWEHINLKALRKEIEKIIIYDVYFLLLLFSKQKIENNSGKVHWSKKKHVK